MRAANPPEPRGGYGRRWWYGAAFALLALVFVGAALLVTQDMGVRTLLGSEALAVACDQDSATILFPLGGAADGQWKSAARLPLARDEVRGVAVGDHIVVGSGLAPKQGVLGGFGSLDELYEFTPRRGRFVAIARLPVPLDHLALAAHGETLYAFGGWSDALPSRRAFRLRNGSWQELPPMSIARGGATATLVGDRVYVIGGATDTHSGGPLPGTGVVEVFDIGRGRWFRGPDMPTTRHHHAAAAAGKVIVVVGGRDGSLSSIAAVDELDTTTGRWSEAPALPLAVGAPSAVTVDGRVLVGGGGDDARGWVTPATWLRLANGGWRRLPDLAVARHGHAMAALDGVAYVLGGSPCAGYGRTDSVERLRVEDASG